MFLYLMALYWSHDYSMCACCFNLQVNLRLILVSGKTKEFLFYPNDSVADVTDFVYRNWPRGNIKPFFPRCNLFKRRCAKLWKMCHVTETPPFPPIKLTPCSLVKKKIKTKKTNIQINQHQAIYQTFYQNQFITLLWVSNWLFVIYPFLYQNWPELVANF